MYFSQTESSKCSPNFMLNEVRRPRTPQSLVVYSNNALKFSQSVYSHYYTPSRVIWLKLRGLPQIMFVCFYVLYIITLVNTHMSQHTTLVNLLQGGGGGEGEGEGEGAGEGPRGLAWSTPASPRLTSRLSILPAQASAA